MLFAFGYMEGACLRRWSVIRLCSEQLSSHERHAGRENRRDLTQEDLKLCPR